MAGALGDKKLGVKILFGMIVLLLSAGMLLYLVPGAGTNTTTSSNEVVADVDGQTVTTTEVRTQLSHIESSGQMQPALRPLYAQQIIQQLINDRIMVIEAQRLGVIVSDADVANRIKLILPTAFENGAPVASDNYAQQVQARFQMGVPEFEDLVRQSLVSERVGQLITSGVAVSPDEVQAEFRRRNEKVKLDYVLVNPDALESQVQVNDADLAAYYNKNLSKYVVPEQRVAQYILINPTLLMAKINIPQSELQAQYNANIAMYQVPDRVQFDQILFKTVGKTDAEIAEIKKKAEDVLKQAQVKNANFEDLAKKNSDDPAAKENGGKMGWIVRGQAIPELEQAAFSLPKDQVSNLIQTSIGFYIIKITDRETAHTKPFAEVMPELQANLATQKAQAMADDDAQKIGDLLRQTAHPSLDAIAKQFDLTVGQTQPLAVNAPAPELGNSPEIHDTILRQRVGDVSQPIRTDAGYTILSVKSINQAHQGSITEMHDKIVADYRHEKAVDLAKQRAADLAKTAQSGDLAKAAKSMNLEMKTSDEVAREGSITGVGPVHELTNAFSLAVGKTGDPVFLGANWVVYRVADHQQPNPDDFAKQASDIQQQLLEAKRQLVFESFRAALEDQLTKEGKLTFHNDVVKQLTQPT
jgi:peptidyl-prolyl cis-trans isomerase D